MSDVLSMTLGLHSKRALQNMCYLAKMSNVTATWRGTRAGKDKSGGQKCLMTYIIAALSKD